MSPAPPTPAAELIISASGVPHTVVARLRRRPLFWGAGAVLGVWVIISLAWPLLGLDPYATGPAVLAPPSTEHLLGTDRLGRDVLARLLAGSRSILLIAPLAASIATVLGSAIALVSGTLRGAVDEVLMRAIDLFFTIPGIVVAVVVLSLTGTSPLALASVIGVLFSPLVARTVRSAVLVEGRRPYVEAARLQGESQLWIMGQEILPNVAPVVVVEATIRLGFAVFTAAALSFLGLGAQPPSPDWGLAISESRIFLQDAPWTVLAPAAAIASMVVAVSLLADVIGEEVER